MRVLLCLFAFTFLSSPHLYAEISDAEVRMHIKKMRAMERAERRGYFRSLAPSTQKRIKALRTQRFQKRAQRMQRFRRMSQIERQRFFKSISASKRLRLKKLFNRFQSITPAERQKRWEALTVKQKAFYTQLSSELNQMEPEARIEKITLLEPQEQHNLFASQPEANAPSLLSDLEGI